MPEGSKTSAENDGKVTNGGINKDGKSSLKQAIEQEASKAREQAGSQEGIDSSEKQSIERIFTKLAKMPYNKAKELTHYDGFALSADEEDLNGILMTYIVLYYLPNIDLGKFCLWAFVILNVALLIEKTVVYVDYKKKLEKEQEPKKIEDKTDEKKE
jgi:hypothetical protein